MNVALCGTHGIGKTTLLNDVWGRYLSEGRSELLGMKLSEQARSVADAMELHTLSDIQLWTQREKEYFQWRVMMNQVAGEYHAVQAYGGFLSDRSVVDNLAYIAYYKCSKSMVDSVRSFMMSHAQHYDILFYMPVPLQFNTDCLADGFRMTALESVIAVDEIILGLFNDVRDVTDVVELSPDRCRWVDEVCDEIDNSA